MSNKVEVSDQVKALVDKAVKAEKSDDALKFSQAACNAANASCAANNAANIAVHSSTS